MTVPDKVILGIADNQGHVFVELDGARHKLRRCKSITIRADANGNNEVDVTLYAFDLTSEVEVTRSNAEAILRADASRQLAFLDANDVSGLIELRHTLLRVLGWPSDDHRLRPIEKIIAELEKRQEIPF